MADGSGELTSAAILTQAPTDVPLWRRAPWWLRVICVYAGARVLTTIVLAMSAAQLTPQSRAGANPDFFSYTALWDGYWYWRIAVVGYPTNLPLDSSGHVMENQWAFMPGYPWVASAFASLTGTRWPFAAFAVSLVFGFAAALVIYRLFALRLDEDQAFFGVVLFSVSPLSFIFQMAYAESLHTFLLALVLYLLARRKWAWMVPVIAVMSMTRPSGLAFALALSLYWVVRYRTRAHEPFPRRDMVWTGALAVFSGLMGLVWPVAAWIWTGSMSAYTDTELAWRAPMIGHQHLIPFAPWFQAFAFWFGSPLGPIIVLIFVTIFVALFFLPAVRRLGLELRVWLVSYGLYLFAVFFPQSSTFRLLIPMFPFAAALAQPKSTAYRIGAVVVSLVLQFAWLWATWGPITSYVSVP